VGNGLISRKSIGHEKGAKKAWNDCKKVSARGAHCGDKSAWPETVTRL
jgi:hypothetical protein